MPVITASFVSYAEIASIGTFIREVNIQIPIQHVRIRILAVIFLRIRALVFLVFVYVLWSVLLFILILFVLIILIVGIILPVLILLVLIVLISAVLLLVILLLPLLCVLGVLRILRILRETEYYWHADFAELRRKITTNHYLNSHIS